MPEIRIKFSFIVFNALIFLFRESEMISGFYIACILHEFGHAAAVYASGGKINRIELSCFGIKITASQPESLISGIIILLSGPAANLLTYFLLKISGADGYLAVYSLAEGIFNLLPYSFLDGGAVLELIAEGSPHERILHKFYFILKAASAAIILNLFI
ncbi:MAG: M50 family metallopeptidase [Ruminococcus sp.]|nr:M50 family metallopeptidase [Ruminococcus sp.]MDE6783992.1 M50 family metallopeptidase [Ruminococcus sp.]